MRTQQQIKTSRLSVTGLAGMAGRIAPLLLFVLACVITTADAQAQSVAQVSDLRLGENGNSTRLVIDVDRELAPQLFTLSDPYRLVIDLPQVDWPDNLLAEREGRGLIRQYRFGLFKPGTSRLVLDLTQPVKLDRFFTLPPRGPYSVRLVFDLVPTSRSEFLASVRKPQQVAARTPDRSDLVPAPSVREQGRRPIIVLDPGHGGVDPGTIGATGKAEKHIVLAISKRIERVLEATGRYDVRLTRDTDVYLRHRNRYEVARRAGADLFISIHADSIDNRSVRGATVYTLSEKASDAEAAALAAKENKSDVLAGIDLANEAPEVSNILIELAQRESMNYSARFASMLVPAMKQRVMMRTNSHRFAGFLVLKSPDVPSVLLEVGYLSNLQDARMLDSADGQQRIATGLLAAVDRYFAVLEEEQRAR